MSLRMTVLAMFVVLTLASLIWCIVTWNDLGTFIFLPGGDVGLGFHSHHGWLSWIEYAWWDQENMYYPWWSVPWAVIIGMEFLMTAGYFVFRLKRHPKRQS